jgi:hypothetical protein
MSVGHPGVPFTSGTTMRPLILDAWRRRERRPVLAERLGHLQPDSLADEARQVARPATPSAPSAEPEWVTVGEAARQLGMSAAWLKSFAKTEQIVVIPRGGRPGVDWTTVEAYIARSRITRVDESLHPNRELAVPGIALLDRVQTRFGWSDRQLARALGVTPAVVSRYRRSGVPNYQSCRLRRLSRLAAEGAVASPPRRRR